MNRSTSRSTSEERQAVGIKEVGIKAIGKKMYKLKELTLYKETKQNYNNLKQKLNKKGKEKKRKEVRNRTQDPLRAGPFHYHYTTCPL